MSLELTVGLVLYTIVSLILAAAMYKLGYNRGWIVGTAEALDDVYGDGGDADE